MFKRSVDIATMTEGDDIATRCHTTDIEIMDSIDALRSEIDAGDGRIALTTETVDHIRAGYASSSQLERE